MRRNLRTLLRAHMQVLGKGEQLEVAGSDGVLAIQAGRNGELAVRSGPAHEAQRFVGQGQIVVNEFLEFSRLLSGGCGNRSSGRSFSLAGPDMPFFQQ